MSTLLDPSAVTKAADRVAGNESTKEGRVHQTWFRGAKGSRPPKALHMMSETAVLDYVLSGWEPPERAINENTKVTAFGSCFAAYISDWLASRHYNVLTRNKESNAYVVSCGEGMVNSFVIRQQFEWAFEAKKFEAPLWHGYKAEEFGYDEDVRQETLRLFNETDVFILTLGLSEVWYDEPTGGVFWRTLPKDKYDPERHKFRVSTVEENRENLREIYRLVRKHRPDAKIILTLSPIPLITTFRDESCISANSVSKAVLRVAIDEVMREFKDEGHIFYWPSYEIVADIFNYPFKEDRRHLYKSVQDFIMMTFERVWCEKGPTDHEYLRQWLRAKSAAGQLHENVDGAIGNRNLSKLRHMLNRNRISNFRVTDDKAKDMLLRFIEEEERIAEAEATAAE
jgi:hypothetical protein